MPHACTVPPNALCAPLCFLFVPRSSTSESVRRRVRRKGTALRLPASEVERFYKLYPALLFYANQQLGLVPHVTTISQLRVMPEEEQYALRAAFYAHREVIEAFVHA